MKTTRILKKKKGKRLLGFVLFFLAQAFLSPAFAFTAPQQEEATPSIHAAATNTVNDGRMIFGGSLSAEDIAKRCSTPWELSKWLGFNIRYERVRDKWQQANETLEKRSGNCVAFAVLSYEVLKRMGFEPRLIEFMPKEGDGHVICAFKDGNWKYMSNDVLVNCGGRADGLNDVVEFHDDHCEWRETDTEGYNVARRKN